jgi:uncharacterized spore protein YtfJ
MNVREVINSAQEAMTVKRVFGEPYEKNGLTVIPAARIGGGAGGGGGEGPEGQGSGEGSGFGLSAKPAGAYVIKGDRVRWLPAVDVNRIILGAQIVAIVGLLTARALARTRRGGDVVPAGLNVWPRNRSKRGERHARARSRK